MNINDLAKAYSETKDIIDYYDILFPVLSEGIF